jgi:hypothetical protein
MGWEQILPILVKIMLFRSCREISAREHYDVLILPGLIQNAIAVDEMYSKVSINCIWKRVDINNKTLDDGKLQISHTFII